jgi:cytoskeletal protein CcmA (bactofilin family)
MLGKREHTVIAEGLSIRGEVNCADSMEVKGHIEGDVRSGHVDVASSAVVVGSIQADSVAIDGKIDGPIVANDVVLKSKARVLGDIACVTITIEKGASFEGRLKRADEGKRPTIKPLLLPERSAH